MGILLAGLGALSACGSRESPNVLLVVVDTLRADRLGCYGNARGLTPFLDSLAARGYVFHHAYAPASWTKPSVASILTSRFASQHGVTTLGSVLGDTEVTLPEVLRARGYRTAGFSANIQISGAAGFGQGFDEFAAYPCPRTTPASPTVKVPERAGRLNAESLAWLARQAAPGPTFLYLQYMEPHMPYDPPAAALVRVAHGPEPPDVARVNELWWLGHDEELSAVQLQSLWDVYDAEVVSLDAELRMLFGALEGMGFLRNAVVVVTADHGEEFREHGSVGHAKTLYNELIHVPLIVLAPGHDTRTDVNDVVSLVDVAPTVLKAIGVGADVPFEGKSLLRASWWDGWGGGRAAAAVPSPAGEGAYSELLGPPSHGSSNAGSHERAVVVGERKLIAGRDGMREFFDLDQDPGERKPDGLGSVDRDRLTQALEVARQRALRNLSKAEVRELDPEAREKLHALGYVD